MNANGELYAVTDPVELTALNAGAKYALPYSEYGIASSQFIENASFLRLQTLTIGYTLPKSLSKKIYLNKVRAYVSASNLFILTKYSGYDPEVDVQSGLTPSMDYNRYPRARTFSFGLNVTF